MTHPQRGRKLDPFSIALLLFAGLAGGTIAALAGGAALITFPILLAVGISPVSAAATNTVAIAPGSIMAAVAERSQLPPLGRSFILLAITSALATLAGGALLAFTPERMFAKVIPALLGFATILLAYTDGITTWIKAHAAARADNDPYRWTPTIIWLMPVSAYGGYFGAGVGVLLLAVLSIGTGGDYRSANVTKNLVMGLNSLVVSAFFFIQELVAWPHVLVMMAGTIAGGFLGARIAQWVSNKAARRIVVVIGTLLTVAFAWRYWF